MCGIAPHACYSAAYLILRRMSADSRLLFGGDGGIVFGGWLLTCDRYWYVSRVAGVGWWSLRGLSCVRFAECILHDALCRDFLIGSRVFLWRFDWLSHFFALAIRLTLAYFSRDLIGSHFFFVLAIRLALAFAWVGVIGFFWRIVATGTVCILACPVAFGGWALRTLWDHAWSMCVCVCGNGGVLCRLAPSFSIFSIYVNITRRFS